MHADWLQKARLYLQLSMHVRTYNILCTILQKVKERLQKGENSQRPPDLHKMRFSNLLVTRNAQDRECRIRTSELAQETNARFECGSPTK